MEVTKSNGSVDASVVEVVLSRQIDDIDPGYPMATQRPFCQVRQSLLTAELTLKLPQTMLSVSPVRPQAVRVVSEAAPCFRCTP
jgi:hypothetical protein